ncbi:MAG: hypothetical protein QXG00_02920 [Candidatus Woesearchaeota archaeon]
MYNEEEIISKSTILNKFDPEKFFPININYINYIIESKKDRREKVIELHNTIYLDYLLMKRNNLQYNNIINEMTKIIPIIKFPVIGQDDRYIYGDITKLCERKYNRRVKFESAFDFFEYLFNYCGVSVQPGIYVDHEIKKQYVRITIADKTLEEVIEGLKKIKNAISDVNLFYKYDFERSLRMIDGFV